MKFVYILALLLAFAPAIAAQDEKEPELWERAEKEADRLQELLDLEDWQAFYVDSTLKHDLPAMMDEYKELQDSKVSNSSLYYMVQDKWMEKIDQTYIRRVNSAHSIGN